MNQTSNKQLLVALVIVLVLFLLFGGGAMSGGMMNGGVHGTGWMDDRGWMWTPATLALVLGIGLGWVIFRKKG